MDWDKFFFSDIGKKIKAIIRICFYVEAILVLIAGCLMELYALWQLLNGNIGGFLAMLLTPVAAALIIGALWLSVLITYGFGEIVDTAVTNRLSSDGVANVVAEAKPKPSSSNILSVIAEQKKEKDENKAFWVCECGMKNAEHAASCKGCGNSRTGAVVSVNGGAYKKCACGAMVKSGEKCPMCGKMVY